MVSPRNKEGLAELPQYGGTLELDFESKEDLEEQIKDNLTHGGLFVKSEIMPRNFSEFQTTVYYLNNTVLDSFQTRLVQCIEFGPQKGFLLQVMEKLDVLKANLDKLLEPVKEEVTNVEEERVEKRSRLTIQQKLRKMTPTERGIFATKADKHTRSVMIRDHEPLVIMFLLKNPRLTRQEVVEISKVKAINYQAIQIILGNKQWVQVEEIRYNLVMNPKTPLQIVLKILSSLNMKHIREIAKNHNMKTQIKQAALRLVVSRSK